MNSVLRAATRTALAVLVTLALVWPAAVWAHGGHTHYVRGTVTERGEGQVTVRQTDGKVVVVKLTAKTEVLKGEQKVDPSALVVGQRIVADVGDGKTPLVARNVKLGVVK
jgi:hypothetical protein